MHWKAFYILTHFIPWMNTSVTISIKTSINVIRYFTLDNYDDSCWTTGGLHVLNHVNVGHHVIIGYSVIVGNPVYYRI